MNIVNLQGRMAQTPEIRRGKNADYTYFSLAVKDNKIMKYKGNEMYFYYPEYFKEQCIPDLKSSASALPELVKKVFNINDEYLLCFLAQLCTFFIPDINNPILVLNGGPRYKQAYYIKENQGSC